MPTVDSDEFFEEQQEHSQIKACIVAEYFWAWAGVMIGVQNRYPQHSKRLAYIDLFSGPGKYDDGTESTPLLIMRHALSKLDLRDRLKAGPRRPAGPPLVGDILTRAAMDALRDQVVPKPTEPKNRNPRK